jgi:Tfp pilus assembly protein PilX
MRLSNFIRLLRRQDGIALVMAIGILGVLTISGTTLVYYSTSNARSAEFSQDNSSAYDLAEAGINEMAAILNNPENNALNEYLLPSATRTYAGGTVQWSGTLVKSVTGASTWSLTSVGRVKNPTGAAANQVTRTLTAKVPVVPTYTQPLNNPSWNFIYSRATGNVCDMTIPQSVIVRSPLYVAGNLCLTNTAGITAGPLVVQGSLTLSQSANYAGTASVPLSQLRVKNGCTWKNNAHHNPCQQGAGASGFDNVYATLLDNAPPVTAPPAVDWDSWYLNANPGPYYGCLESSGTPPTFDNDQGLATAPNIAKRNHSLTTVQNLTPGSSYTCKASAGELSWNAVTKVLTVNGTIFIDGSVKVENGFVNTYTGSGTMYVSGTFLMKNSKLCQATTGSGASMTCTTANWDPAARMFCVVANGNGSNAAPQNQVGAGDSVQLVSAYGQGAFYATNGIEIDTTSNFDGPLDGSTVKLGQSTSSSFPGLSFVPAGMPGNPDVYAEPQPPQLYSG